MDKYRLQLEQVKNSLENDPNNVELQSLREKIEKLLELKALSKKATSSTPKMIQGHSMQASLHVGETCEVWFNGTWRPAKVAAYSSGKNFYIAHLGDNGETMRFDSVHIRRKLHDADDLQRLQETKSLSTTPSQRVTKSLPKRPKAKPETAKEAKSRSDWKKFISKVEKK